MIGYNGYNVKAPYKIVSGFAEKTAPFISMYDPYPDMIQPQLHRNQWLKVTSCIAIHDDRSAQPLDRPESDKMGREEDREKDDDIV